MTSEEECSYMPVAYRLSRQISTLRTEKNPIVNAHLDCALCEELT
jgi:hypothetical protein